MILEGLIVEILKEGDATPEEISVKLGVHVEIVNTILQRLRLLGIVENNRCS